MQHIARRKNNNWSRHQNTCQIKNHWFPLCFASVFERVASIQTTGVKIHLVFVLIWEIPGVHVRQLTVSITFGGRATATQFISIIDKSKLTPCFGTRGVPISTNGFPSGPVINNSVQRARPRDQKVDPRRVCQAKNRVPAERIQWFLHNDVANSSTGQRRGARRNSLRPLLLIIRIEEELLLLLLLLPVLL